MTHFLPTPGATPVPFETIREYCGGKLYVLILNNTKPNGKTDWTNTDTYGGTELIHKSQIVAV